MTHTLLDPRDPAYHDASGMKAVDAIVRRRVAWVSSLAPEDQARFCEHGSYVGYQKALAHKCPMCQTPRALLDLWG